MSTQQPERPKCSTCPYWEQMVGGQVGSYGECRRRPPRILGRMAKPQNGSEILTTMDVIDASRFPVTEDCDFCGAHPDFPAWLAAVRTPKTDADGPYLVTSDTREDWQCDTDQQVRDGLAKREQWSEPFSVFRFDGSRFVKVFLSEDAAPKT